MRDQWMNNCLVVYIERDVTRRINNEDVMQQFQNMKHCKKQCVFSFIFLFFCDADIFKFSFVLNFI